MLDDALEDEEDIVIGQTPSDFVDEVIRKARKDGKAASKYGLHAISHLRSQARH